MIIHQKIIFKRRNSNCNKKDRQMKINLKENSLLETKTNNTLHIPTREEFHRMANPLIYEWDFQGYISLMVVGERIKNDENFQKKCIKNYENRNRRITLC